MTVGLLLGAAPAHAWYVDITITGGGRVYETTDANEIDEHCPDAIEGFASPGTTPTGTVGASCQAGSASGDYGHGWVVRYVAEAAPGYRFDGWQSDGRTTPGPVICDGSGGSSSYSGAACQFATFQNLQTRARFVDDTIPAMSSLTGPNTEVNGPATFTFSAVSDPTFARFECRVAGVHEWQTCSSGRQEDPASSGTYTFEVRAVDHSGNRSPGSSWQWIVDKISPDTSITGGPSGTVASTSAMFTFIGSADVASYECSLDGVTSTCASPKSYAGLGQGTHTFAVRAVDDAGNKDGTPDTRTWTVDTVAPETTITEGPASVSSGQAVTFRFSSPSGDVGGYSCRLDDGAIETACVSPVTYTGVAGGPHVFRVWARDLVGNQDVSPASWTWTVDAVAPETTMTDGPTSGSISPSQSATFTFSGTEAGTFECQLDGTSWTVCESPRTYASLSQGAHTFAVRARDGVGNVDDSPATRTWTVDTVAPQTTITDGPVEGSASSPQTATFIFTSTEAGTFECQLDGSSWTSCTSPREYTGLSEGAHTFAVRARDAAGNLDGSPATRAWTVALPVAPPPTTTSPSPSPSPSSTPSPSTSPSPTPPLAGGEPTATPATMDVRSTFRYRVSDSRTTVRLLKLTRLPSASTVKVSCKGKGCAFKKTLKPSTSYVVLTKLFKNRKLSAGTVIKMGVTAAGYEPTAFRYKTRKGSKSPIGGQVARHTTGHASSGSGFGAF